VIPYEVPAGETLPERLESVTAVIYLVFNEGYSASAGDEIVRKDLCSEAIRLARILIGLMPDEPELQALLALMLIQDSRRDARITADGDLILLEDQDRNRWDRRQIDEGLALLARVIRQAAPGPYAIQAAIAAEHARANRFEDTDWSRIADLYSTLFEMRPTPVVELNRAVAIAMARGPEHGLEIVAHLEASGELDDYYLMWAVKADLLRRLGRFIEAGETYRRAIEVVTNNADRRFLEKRLREMASMNSRAD
jgi:RNA polymerase sigma-70 factor (ECF subfamily)